MSPGVTARRGHGRRERCSMNNGLGNRAGVQKEAESQASCHWHDIIVFRGDPLTEEQTVTLAGKVMCPKSSVRQGGHENKTFTCVCLTSKFSGTSIIVSCLGLGAGTAPNGNFNC